MTRSGCSASAARDTRAAGPGLLGGRRQVGLLPLRRRQVRVVRRLARGVELSLQLGNTRAQQPDLRRQRLDLRLLRQDQGDQIVRGQTEEGFAVHGYGEPQAPLPRQDVGSRELKLHHPTGGGEQLPTNNDLPRLPSPSKYLADYVPKQPSTVDQIKASSGVSTTSPARIIEGSKQQQVENPGAGQFRCHPPKCQR